ncbi:hypothetical protein EHQ16_12515 [Leptospira kanakyensis]|uniref:Lipoprotein n=1 Tax=Leptospira kanakyensis TaxID=2484968 RepID=A0A6N4PWZ0_9LEPT|nr:hypothetical protein [Leptospira kanakyensis]TGK50067.1 hypothetical protein EHQ11_10105 [Leptospira kanakyensis]TGK58415.1 hypothetical protein EHQ16_12515 [Leptospira kanakyensis]TGK69205.1 hypothetical protein EHQ18_10265 [Leptospira kanakyensis]
MANKMINQIKYIALLITTLSCMTIPIENYELNHREYDKISINKTAKILIFEDLRKGENKDDSILAMIPLVFSAGAKLNFPEADTLSVNSPIKYYIADIIKKELANQYQLKKIFISENISDNEDFNIFGKINTYTCNRYSTTYGLGLFGVFTWYFGAPIFKTECILNLEIIIKNKSGGVIFNNSYLENETNYIGLYYNLTTSSKIHPMLMKKVMYKINLDLKSILR